MVDVALDVFQHLFTSVSLQTNNVESIRAHAEEARLESAVVESSLDQVIQL
ncbi:hypothetical protein GCM10025859_50060 [Alicyclobacillus fastidiosus]|nr:hypothetical protein GCM10025859_50060 [Alicyclobacillus fastidiosus]